MTPVHTVRQLLAATALAWADVHDDIKATYDAKNYAHVLKLTQPLADKGNAQAQFNLGALSANGEGVEQNDQIARQWWDKAAAQGNASALKALDKMRAAGR